MIGAALLLAGCGRAGEAREEFNAVALESRAAEGEQVLKQAFVLQQAYHARNERYAATFAALREEGWEDPPGLQFYQSPRIVRAQGDELCMVIEPRQASLWPHHVDQAGEVRRGPCP